MKQLKKAKTTIDVLSINEITDYSVKTDYGELVYLKITPTNLSVLSDKIISERIYSLTNVLKSVDEIEIICLNSKENFDDNKKYLNKRIEQEENRQIKELLIKDSQTLDKMQTQIATSRDFFILIRLYNLKENEMFNRISAVEKCFKEQGFIVSRADEQQIKRLLGLYFEQNAQADSYDEQLEGKTFTQMIAPSVIKFNIDHYICGNTFRCVYALREYPTVTDEQAILQHLGEKDGVTLHIYARQVTANDEKKILQNATNKNKINSENDDIKQSVTAQHNLQDVVTLVSSMHRNKEPLLHCAVYIELIANNLEKLKELQSDVMTQLVRSKLNVDKLFLQQQTGFLAVNPVGRNTFLSQFERVLPASSVANFYPFAYSGKTDSQGFYLGKDKFGSHIFVDFDKREEDKTNPCVLILGNSGQGKSFLFKTIMINLAQAGKNIICLDPEEEMRELAQNLGGCYIDLMSGEYIINPIEPKIWEESSTSKSVISQHISFLKDFFRSYKDFTDRHIDVIEIMLSELYRNFKINNTTIFSDFKSSDYPTLSDLYKLIDEHYKHYDENEHNLYTLDLLQDILLGLHSMCVGAESKFFNGHTNITSNRIIVFGVKRLLQASKNVKNAMLFSVLSYMSDKLLREGNTVAGIDELYLFLSNMIAIEYIRNCMKRVRKRESAVVLSSQNIEDFNIDGIRELTKPLFSIPTHTFLFNVGNVDETFLMDNLKLEQSEYNLIKMPQRGVCLYKCGNERYNLVVNPPEYKQELFGSSGGR